MFAGIHVQWHEKNMAAVAARSNFIEHAEVKEILILD